MTARPIRATYRLQFHRDFPLARATALVRYLDRLGVSHIHSSPLLRARPGSTHGYDVVDPTRLNPEIGTDDDLHDLIRALHRRRMGLLLDIVPNHMAAAPENAAWEDVLRHGAASPFARWFDIDWRSDEPARWSRIVLPVLGERRARLLERDEISLRYDAARGEWRVVYGDHSYPVDPATLGLVYGWLREVALEQGIAPDVIRRLERAASELRRVPRQTDASPAALAVRRDTGERVAREIAPLWRGSGPLTGLFRDAVARFHRGDAGRIRIRRLLDAQPYRMVHWRRAARELNYRRFFDVNDLVALRMEDPEVFQRIHALVLNWTWLGWLDGFRIDHLDGLLDPAA
ncbi:MAG TPA: alpha-amylase family glycosyl hydrolase, partial [Gemmatimonadales bacterium]|nr:alpha-amylase family glycosyl hydrolase [Gemmatimonadales bacterium]